VFRFSLWTRSSAVKFSNSPWGSSLLIPDSVHPEQTIYFNGAIVLRVLHSEKSTSILDLYAKVKSLREMSLPVFMLCMDWLFLIDALSVTEKGMVELCF